MAGRACMAIVLGLCCVTGGPALAQRTVQVSGLVYAGWHLDFGPGAGGDNRFDISRAYVTLSGRTSERVSGRLTTDAIREQNRELSVRLKFAFVQYQVPGSAIAIRFGLTGTPAVPFEEALWDYRMHGPMPADRNKYLSSADVGLVMDGRWGAGERVQLTSGVYNGEGWAGGTGDAGKDVMTRLTVRVAGSGASGPLGGLRLTGYGHYGRPTGGGERHRVMGMLSWHEGPMTLAAQALVARDERPAEELDRTDAVLVNAFAVYRIPRSGVALIGRAYRLDPERNGPDDALSTLLAGVSYQVAPELRLLASFEATRYEGVAPTPAAEAARRQVRVQLSMVF